MSLTDRVWDRIDPGVGRLSARARRNLVAWVALGAVIVAVVLTLTVSGLFLSRLTATPGVVERADTDSCRAAVTIRNNGWFAEQVVTHSVRSSSALVQVLGPVSSTIPSGGSIRLPLAVPFSWCADAAHGASQPSFGSLVLALHRPWGVSTQTLHIASPRDYSGFVIDWN